MPDRKRFSDPYLIVYSYMDTYWIATTSSLLNYSSVHLCSQLLFSSNKLRIPTSRSDYYQQDSMPRLPSSIDFKSLSNWGTPSYNTNDFLLAMMYRICREL